MRQYGATPGLISMDNCPLITMLLGSASVKVPCNAQHVIMVMYKGTFHTC